MRSERGIRAAWWTAGGVAALGLILSIIGGASPVSFGWFAYQPLSAEIFSPLGVFSLLPPASIAGGLLLALGLLGLAFLTGHRVGVRSTRPRDESGR